MCKKQKQLNIAFPNKSKMNTQKSVPFEEKAKNILLKMNWNQLQILQLSMLLNVGNEAYPLFQTWHNNTDLYLVEVLRKAHIPSESILLNDLKEISILHYRLFLSLL